MEVISSPQNKRIRYVRALQTKPRLRRSESKFVLEGDRLIADALNCGGKAQLALYSPEHADYELIARLQGRECALLPVDDALLQRVSDTQQAPGILALFQIPRPPLPKTARRMLILDAIREPGNLGAILRTAAAAGVDLVILAPDSVDPYNSKAARAAMGAHFRLPIVEASWKEIGVYCRDLTVYAALPAAPTSYTDVNWRESCALIVGSEAHGLSERGRTLANEAISIPMSRSADSLNVASAAAVILFEAQRQRVQVPW
ncbi:MAG: RNA methyltransferase [Chloroflexi bacterium]|nr:RNA methyltransferase [Chloroflexota bacterium]